MKIIKYSVFSILLAFSILACCDTSDEQNDCMTIDFNNSLYEEGPTDPGTHIISYEIVEDCLELKLQYGGGCEEHDIKLGATGWAESEPVQVMARVVHLNTDPCDGLITESYKFDLTDIRYGNNKKIIINLEGIDEKIWHTYSD